MTRHGRNATNSAVYTYHERVKDAKASGYGTEHARLGKDSLKGFDCCSLTLQPCRTPMVSPEGWLFDKEAVLKYIIEKKQEYARKLKEYERQKDRDLKDLHDIADAERQANVEKFEKAEKSILPNSSSASGSSSSSKNLPSFWVLSLTPQAKKSKVILFCVMLRVPEKRLQFFRIFAFQVEKPDKTIYCPMSGKPLKFKNLIEVKFMLLEEEDDTGPSSSIAVAGKLQEGKKKKSLIAREERYKCAVTQDILNNSTPVAVLKTTGDVVTAECVEKIIRKDMLHPLNGTKLEEKDIIFLQRGGTGYSSTNEESLKATHYRPNLAIS